MRRYGSLITINPSAENQLKFVCAVKRVNQSFRKVKVYKSGVIKDPHGQSHSQTNTVNLNHGILE